MDTQIHLFLRYLFKLSLLLFEIGSQTSKEWFIHNYAFLSLHVCSCFTTRFKNTPEWYIHFKMCPHILHNNINSVWLDHVTIFQTVNSISYFLFIFRMMTLLQHMLLEQPRLLSRSRVPIGHVLLTHYWWPGYADSKLMLFYRKVLIQ